MVSGILQNKATKTPLTAQCALGGPTLAGCTMDRTRLKRREARPCHLDISGPRRKHVTQIYLDLGHNFPNDPDMWLCRQTVHLPKKSNIMYHHVTPTSFCRSSVSGRGFAPSAVFLSCSPAFPFYSLPWNSTWHQCMFPNLRTWHFEPAKIHLTFTSRYVHLLQSPFQLPFFTCVFSPFLLLFFCPFHFHSFCLGGQSPTLVLLEAQGAMSWGLGTCIDFTRFHKFV